MLDTPPFGTTVDEQRFELSSSNIAMQVIDGEAILIDFERGHYFSARGLGCELLGFVALGCTARELVEALGRNGFESAQVERVVSRYLERLVGEGLIAPSATARAPRENAEQLRFDSRELTEPELVKYTDLADLLLLDPIHDVDDRGWPPPERASPVT
jgi:hypothetical protein